MGYRAKEFCSALRKKETLKRDLKGMLSWYTFRPEPIHSLLQPLIRMTSHNRFAINVAVWSAAFF